MRERKTMLFYNITHYFFYSHESKYYIKSGYSKKEIIKTCIQNIKNILYAVKKRNRYNGIGVKNFQAR